MLIQIRGSWIRKWVVEAVIMRTLLEISKRVITKDTELTRARTDAYSADLDVFDGRGLWNRNGEAFGRANAAGDALDEVSERLGGVECNEAACAGVGGSVAWV
jgi:hypothetical protein